jgi:hypothetical protein
MALGDFDNDHKLLTVFGTAFTTETWSFGLRFKPVLGVDAPLPSQAQADAAATIVKAWWQNVNTPFGSSTTLQGVKLAPIAVNGKYPPTGLSYVGDINPDLSGVLNTNIHPPQVAIVATLLSASIPRGRGHAGRIYLPAPALSVSSSGQVGDTGTLFATPLRTMIQALNDMANLGNCVIMSRESTKNGVVLPAGSSFVGSVRVDNVLDTQRRRRRSIVGVRYTSAAITAP